MSRPSQLEHRLAWGDVTPVDARSAPSLIAQALRSGKLPSDRVFDRFLPNEFRASSAQYWTPLAVAARAAEWLDQLDVQSVVDIGSGTGKFCVAAALLAGARFTGIEQRLRLVDASRQLAGAFDLNQRITFLHSTFGEAPVPKAEAYYMYNPFGENLFGLEDRLDDEVELGGARYLRDVAAVERLLAGADVGTFLLTYNGFGGALPADYREVRVDRELPNVLRMWRKIDSSSSMSGRARSKM
jgi:SAM-dependent methyltransferase